MDLAATVPADRARAARTRNSGDSAAERSGPGVMPLLRAAGAGRTDLALEAFAPAAVDHALACGLGPLLAHVTADGPDDRTERGARVRAADLTARMLTADKYDVVAQVLEIAGEIDCPVALLKGTATAVQYYPAPHHRTMGDIDLLVPEDRRPQFEARLRAAGLRQLSRQSPESFAGRHHSMPFWHEPRDVWMDVHTSLCPPDTATAQNRIFSPPGVWARLVPMPLGPRLVLVMPAEMQLVYTCARWSERFEARRGICPLMDAAFLLRSRPGLQWDHVLGQVEGSWLCTALRLMLTYLHRWQLAPVPDQVLARLAASDRHANRLSLRLLHALVTAEMVQPGRARVGELVWTPLVRPASPAGNLLAVPAYVAFPPSHTDRFNLRRAARRVVSFVGRTWRHRPDHFASGKSSSHASPLSHPEGR